MKMNKRLMASVVVLGLVILIGSLAANAQAPAKEIYTKVSFPFVVGEKIFMPGDYRILRVDDVKPSIKVISWDGTSSVQVPVITRLAQQEHSEHDTKESLVFDRVGDQSFLSEVWMLGEDGYLVRGTVEEHHHTVVPAKHRE
jgi:hypothetical protein